MLFPISRPPQEDQYMSHPPSPFPLLLLATIYLLLYGLWSHGQVEAFWLGTISRALSYSFLLIAGYTVTKAFGGLVIFHAITGNITSYSREIYAQLKSLLLHGFFPSIAGNYPSFVFLEMAGTVYFPGSTWALSQVQPGNTSCQNSLVLMFL